MPTSTWEELIFLNKFSRIWINQMGIYFYCAILRRTIFFYPNKYVWFFLMLTIPFCFSTKIRAEENLSAEYGKSDQRSFETRIATPEPEFFSSWSSSESIRFYFGVGFRNVKLQVANDVIISDSDGEANGIGTNLGFFWEEQAVEYERQISIIEHSDSLSYETQTGQKLEVIQNNFWYILYPKLSMKFYLHYGAGIQFTKTRFAATGSNTSYEDEIAIGAETGVTYFVMSNLKLFYRFSVGRQIPFLKTSDSSAFLKQSQLHTIFLNYYIPL